MRCKAVVVSSAILATVSMLSCTGAEGQAQDVRLPKLAVEVLRKVYQTAGAQWELDLTKAEVQRQKACPKTKCNDEPSKQPPEFLLASYTLGTARMGNESTARLLEAQAKGLAIHRIGASTGAGITPSAFSEPSASSLGVIAEMLVRAEIARSNAGKDELFERIIAYETALENNCGSAEYTAISIANETVEYELLTQAVPAQAENLRALTKRVNLQPLLQAREKFEDRLDAARKKNPGALKAHAAAEDRRRRLEGTEFAKSRTQYEAVLRGLGVR